MMVTEKKGLEGVAPAAGWHGFTQMDDFMMDGTGGCPAAFLMRKKAMGLLPAILDVRIGQRPQLAWRITINVFLNQQKYRLHQAAGIGEDIRPQEPGEGRGIIEYPKMKPFWNGSRRIRGCVDDIQANFGAVRFQVREQRGH